MSECACEMWWLTVVSADRYKQVLLDVTVLF